MVSLTLDSLIKEIYDLTNFNMWQLPEDINKILKEMWRLDEYLSKGEMLSTDDQVFFNTNLQVIKDYYEKQNAYWQNKEVLI